MLYFNKSHAGRYDETYSQSDYAECELHRVVSDWTFIIHLRRIRHRRNRRNLRHRRHHFRRFRCF